MFYVQNVKYSDFPNIKGIVLVKNSGRIEFGNNININSGFFYNPIGGNKKCYLITKSGAKITIGNGTSFSNTTIYSFKEIEIGDNVFIGGGCEIYDSDFHSLILEERLQKCNPGIKAKPIKIQNGAFIGAYSIILKGVIIGENSIIGAGSVITKNIPPNEIWAGNPVEFIRRI
jgi:acetyltransferase-like isoleucine patch superfamily enzyme